MEFSKQQLIGFFGAFLLLIGVFLPVISAPLIGTVSLINNGKGDGMIICGLAILSFVIIALKRIKLLWLSGGISFLLLSYDLYTIASTISKTKAEVTSKLQGNPFGGLAEAMMSSIQLQYGWVILFIGCIILIITPYLQNNDKSEEVSQLNDQFQPPVIDQKNKKVVVDLFDYNEKANMDSVEMKSCPFCHELIRLTAIKCKHCNSMLE
ncbi:hypothetical protein F895_02597 [Acinetobacter sp. CIP 64.2]|uniref:hypothetical protein n=1 Tax=Acinetobacter TaxID=469 RepID=UPI00028A1249|nr:MULTISPECIES: hypothetical protein [Acinetobacter]ENX13293.1 hypothetical protein F895_02597 [Acinetobacter sp. CIP 64.2]